MPGRASSKMQKYLSFFIKLFIYTLMIACGLYLLRILWNPSWIHEYAPNMIWFYFALTLLSGLIVQFLLNISEENSVPILLGAGLIRLLASLGFVFVVLWMGAENLLWFVVNFFVIYLLYLLFDIYMFITNLRPNSE